MLFLAWFSVATCVSAYYTPRYGPRTPVELAPRSVQTCTVKASGGNATDDTPGILSTIKNCSSDSVILFEKGVNYNLFTPLNASGLRNVEIQMYGNLHLSQNITAVQKIVNATTSGNVYWITIAGSNVNYTGTTNVSSGWVYGYGQAWWDANAVNGTGTPSRPHLFYWNLASGYIRNLKIRKPIAWVNNVAGSNIVIENTFIEANTAPGHGFPFNTDGFDLAGTNITMTDFVIMNGDDAVTIENGASNIKVSNGLIGGPGCHGTSIGSLGSAQGVFNSVSNVHFSDITVQNCVYGARFKSYLGGQGLVTNITWENFHVENVTYPIYVTQNYFNQGSAQTQNGAGAQTGNSATGGRVDNATVVMKDFTYRNWMGTTNTYQPGDGSCVTTPCWYDVQGTDGTQAVVVGCSNSTSCQNYRFENIQIVPQSQAVPRINCTNLDAASNPNLGLICQNGTFVAV